MRLCLLVEKNVRCGSLSNERTRLAPIFLTTESSRSRGCLLVVFGPDQYVTYVFAKAVRYTRRREENASGHRCEEPRMFKLLEMT